MPMERLRLRGRAQILNANSIYPITNIPKMTISNKLINYRNTWKLNILIRFDENNYNYVFIIF